MQMLMIQLLANHDDTTTEDGAAFRIYRLALYRIEPFKRSIYLLALSSLGLLLIIGLNQLVSQSSSAGSGSLLILLFLLGSCLLHLIILIFALQTCQQASALTATSEPSNLSNQTNGTPVNAATASTCSNHFRATQLLVLASSSILATSLAILSNQLIGLMPAFMFITYTLLAVDNQTAFITNLVANLVHLIISALLLATTDHNKQFLQESSYFDSNLNSHSHSQVLDQIDGLNVTAAPSSSISMNNKPKVVNQSNLVSSLSLVIVVYVYFHMVGLYLNKKSYVNCKKSFNDIKSHVSAKVMMDKEDKKLTKLMESVIPKHLAGKMRHDILLPEQNEIFHRIYLDSFDNVSILFADIVNFTKISSACSAQLLVETLNELFGRFDKAADKNLCLRIKILGDCYYCVSGIPDMNEEHAIRSVEMGLDMIDILGDIAQDSSGVDLNMRVGIHSGRVLCGVLGKKKWQFDVHSNDVKLANLTEQTGVPGRVHITEDTLKALKGKYEVEPANGHLRDTYIAQKNISTYFVIAPPNRRSSSNSMNLFASFNVLRGPLGTGTTSSCQASSVTNQLASQTTTAQPTTIVTSGSSSKQQQQPGAVKPARSRFKLATQRLINALHFIRTIDAPFANLEAPSSTNIDRVMHQTIVSRCQVQDIRRLTLKFKDAHMSELYRSPLPQKLLKRLPLFVSLLACLLLLTLQTNITTTTTNFASSSSQEIPSTSIANHNLLLSSPHPHPHDSYSSLTNSYNTVNVDSTTNTTNTTTMDMTTIKATKNTGGSFSLHHQADSSSSQPVRLLSSAIVAHILLIFLISLLVYIHHTEYNARRDFLWRQTAMQDKDRMSLMRNSNRFIFFNLLPPHVAHYFLEQRVARSHMDLYHKSYDRVGVLFASISNFSDFYSEVQGNNHGLECLRLLNEIICDFDTILDDERFKAIDKIKTVGSTYMAAIGLFPDYELPSASSYDINATQDSTITGASSSQEEFDSTSYYNNATPRTARPSEDSIVTGLSKEVQLEVANYLKILVDFVLEMKSRLYDINEHSYNCFKLRAGINLGPVTAGVIGASKPQYDIWGNTVNVASRMETTAEAEKIQVTEDVYKILKSSTRQPNLEFTCRGRINVKGKGYMTTYYLHQKN